MSEGPSEKRYNTNPLDKRIAERAEAQMGEESEESELPTRPMPPDVRPAPIAGGPTESMPGPPTAGSGLEPGLGTHGVYAPPLAESRPAYEPPAYAAPQALPPQAYGEPPALRYDAAYGPYEPRAGAEKFGLKPNFAAMLCYLPFLGIVPSFYLNKNEPRQNRFVCFHARQALIAHICFWALSFVFNIARDNTPGLISFFLVFPQIAFYLGSLVGFVMMMAKAHKGERAKIPIIGEQAE